jgi:hypothetical protein
MIAQCRLLASRAPDGSDVRRVIALRTNLAARRETAPQAAPASKAAFEQLQPAELL